MSLYHVLGAKQFNRLELEEIIRISEDMEEIEKNGGSNLYSNKVMTTLFFEPSTRTRLSFESAMCRLGGKIIGTENAAQFSSAIKGETIEDSIRVISNYCDVIVIRHTEIGAANRAADVATVPIINAGDGAGEHPTQALLDLYTIKKELGYVDGLSIAMVGDLTYGRTVHSLSYLLSYFNNIKIYYTAPENVQIPQYVKKFLEEKGVWYQEVDDLNSIASKIDVLYQTRIQKERFPTIEDYQLASGKYVVDKGLLDKLKSNSVILHPLPRAGEIEIEVDQDHRAGYFRQARNGLYVRMALLHKCFKS
ncbi:aspartate carbamoyltransferase [Desulfuribacillus stibiiarsenatis]|uniref:Aspartate carbamoyltransferase n=1 Tax=Desulfuribacillus stibiiarsenatis TaxID=1390249 RepID=A0A1E5L3S6_9FIRM|nr:aspartate carbamoyltransferase [Desulfuribacillus stibiiarsenatis]OEH84800.1 aspartate carbamoyltransferase [Desulfuribacillus stibiiarsenatis]